MADVATAAGQLDREDRATTRALVLEVAGEGISTAGELVDHIETLGPAQRRLLLADARVGAGLPAPDQVEAQERFRAAQPGLPVSSSPARDDTGAAIQSCPVCGAPAVDANGVHRPRRERRWHCPEHVHLAGEKDMADFEWVRRFSPAGVFEVINPMQEEIGQERQRNREARV